MHEIPQVIAEDLESESTTPDVPDKKIENHVPDKKVENHVQELWQTTSKQLSIDTDVPQTDVDGFISKDTKRDIANLVKPGSNSPKSILSLGGSTDVPLLNVATNGTVLNFISCGTDAGLL